MENKQYITSTALIRFFIIIGIFAIFYLLFKKCNNDKIIITTPEIVNKVNDTIVYHYEVDVYKEVPKWYKDTKSENELKNYALKLEKRLLQYENEREVILNDFSSADSLSKIELFLKTQEIKTFENVHEDEDIIINNKGLVKGEVKEITTFYNIKSRKIEVPIKSKLFSLRGGLGYDIDNLEPVYKIGVGYRNYKIDYLPIQKIGLFSYEINF